MSVIANFVLVFLPQSDMPCVASSLSLCLSPHWTGEDADRAQKHGMDEFISANPCNFDHGSLFELVQRLTLDHRLNDSYSCLVRTDFVSM